MKKNRKNVQKYPLVKSVAKHDKTKIQISYIVYTSFIYFVNSSHSVRKSIIAVSFSTSRFVFSNTIFTKANPNVTPGTNATDKHENNHSMESLHHYFWKYSETVNALGCTRG